MILPQDEMVTLNPVAFFGTSGVPRLDVLPLFFERLNDY
ncbi:hypothetical protein LfDm3_1219 [Fructilactobacillus fructivorans]|uniref:Uncharacterized protein n=1 Tax=Fructilactobacillus fructivorans TaxID=1614 RepID=A0A0C1PZH6_9LACO|nr:hypothetical protein LfDm3_1219 [Fructilactobacillus fructivorans]